MLGAANSAAAVGVGARKSATKSAIVKSVSWPTAEIIGISLLKIALATISSLKAHNSSIEPPPRPTISTSISPHFIRCTNRLYNRGAADSPCTSTGNTITFPIDNDV